MTAECGRMKLVELGVDGRWSGAHSSSVMELGRGREA